MMNKKGLSDIVTNVLIILLVLVAVSIVWFFVRGAIEGSAGNLEGATDCYTVELEPTACDSSTDIVTVKRKAGSGDLVGIKVLADGVLVSSGDADGFHYKSQASSLGELSSVDLTGLTAINSGEVITVAPMVANGAGHTTCSASPTELTCA